MKNDALNVNASEKPKRQDVVRSIKAVCPNCRRKYRLDERYAGRRLQCRSCGEKVEVSRQIDLVERPAEQAPHLAVRILRAIASFLTGGNGRTPLRRSRWLSTRQARAGTTMLGLAAVAAMIAGAIWYWSTDAAKLRFGRPEGKEITVRRIVVLEEQLGDLLAGVRSPSDAGLASEQIESVVAGQCELWETLADWKVEGFLTDGELSLLRTRYRDRYEQAETRVAAERLRVGRIAEANQQVLAALGSRGSDLTIARQRVLGGVSF